MQCGCSWSVNRARKALLLRSLSVRFHGRQAAHISACRFLIWIHKIVNGIYGPNGFLPVWIDHISAPAVAQGTDCWFVISILCQSVGNV